MMHECARLLIGAQLSSWRPVELLSSLGVLKHAVYVLGACGEWDLSPTGDIECVILNSLSLAAVLPDVRRALTAVTVTPQSNTQPALGFLLER